MQDPMDEPRDTPAPVADGGTDSFTAPTAPPRTYERPPLPPLPAPSYSLPVEPRPPQVKAPLLALGLSFFPGLGQLYNEQPAKAVTFFFAFVGSIYGAAEISPLPFAFLIPFVWFYNLIDAWNSAQDINRRVRDGALVRKDSALESPAWGAGLLLLGLVLLLHNFGWLRLSALNRFWPLALVIAGGIFLARALRARQAPPAGGPYDERPL
jgi:TM2 domain-containing membrane protein YozV